MLFLFGSFITLIVFATIGHFWQKRQATRVRDIPLYFFLLLSLAAAWYPLLNDHEIHFSAFHPSWGFLPPRLASLICLAIPLAFLPWILTFCQWCKSKSWFTNIFSFWESVENECKSRFPSIFSFWEKIKNWCGHSLIQCVLWLSMCFLCFIGIGGFFLNDYGRLANWTVLQSAQESSPASDSGESDPAQPNNTSASRRTLNEVGEFSARIMFPFIGGVAIIVTLILNGLRTRDMMEQTKNTMEQIKNTTKTLENSQKQIRSEQFKNAIDHLGSDKQAIVLGGVHALNDLALSDEDYRKQVFEILCSFIREETSKPEYQTQVRKKLGMKEPDNPKKKKTHVVSSKVTVTSPIVIQTIIDKLFREKESREIYNEAFKEKQANLREAFLQGINLSDAKMLLVDLGNADLQDAELWRADLNAARLWNTNLKRAKLSHAKLQWANLGNANLQEADLHDAELKGIQTTYIGIASLRKTFRNSEKGLPTDLSGITLYDDEGNKLITEDEKKKWFTDRGANVDDLTAEEVRRIGQKLGLDKE